MKRLLPYPGTSAIAHAPDRKTTTLHFHIENFMPAFTPDDITQLIATVLSLLLVLIPVAGWTLRFALKPLVEAYSALRQTSPPSELVILQRRILELEVQVRTLEARTSLPDAELSGALKSFRAES